MIFVLGASLAMPSLASSPRSSAWLRQFLIMGVLVPIYLFSGISKLRY